MRSPASFKPRISVTLLGTIIALLAASLSAVALVVLAGNYRLARALSERQIEAAASDVGRRIAGFLEPGPKALGRLHRLVADGAVTLEDAQRLALVLAAEAAGAPKEELLRLVSGEANALGTDGGDLEGGYVWAGQCAGLIGAVEPAGEVVRRMAAEAAAGMARLRGMVAQEECDA